MSFHAWWTVPKCHFGPRKCQTLLLIMIEKKIPLSAISGHIRTFQVEWNGVWFKNLHPWTLSRRWRAVGLTCGWSFLWALLWCLNNLSLYGISSMSVGSVDKFEFPNSAFGFEYFWLGKEWHDGRKANCDKLNLVEIVRPYYSHVKLGWFSKVNNCIPSMDVLKNKGAYISLHKSHVRFFQPPS